VTALEYHDATKHHFNRFARSAGHLDWATQPNPFRRFAGAALLELPRAAVAPDVPYDAIFGGEPTPIPVDLTSVADLLRCAFGLSAWKQYGSTRWALRVNPSSGNLHPTEAYIVWNGEVSHYAPREHALERRASIGAATPLLVGLTSIFWREAWKYGERAFRYCQHDLGHAIGALRCSAARLGWRALVLSPWRDADVATLLGVDRDDDFGEAEREAAECLLAVWPADDPEPPLHPDGAQGTALLAAARAAAWQGVANVLSPRRVEWPIIDDVAAATVSSGIRRQGGSARGPHRAEGASTTGATTGAGTTDARTPDASTPEARVTARSIMLRRRSAVAFDGRSWLPASVFLRILSRLRADGRPADALDWPPNIHLALFVHRVEGLVPGIYAWLRDPAARAPLQSSMRPQFLWEAAGRQLPTAPASGADEDDRLFLLLPTDVQWPATRVSCDQDIAGEGFFSVAMLAPLRSVLADGGEPFYRRLFWEAGLLGQVLYLEAEAAGARSTGIGCYYDDAVHELLGLPSSVADGTSSADWQSLYHFSMGRPVEDERLTTEPGYAWETRAAHAPHGLSLDDVRV
jgi:nitroreductase